MFNDTATHKIPIVCKTSFVCSLPRCARVNPACLPSFHCPAVMSATKIGPESVSRALKLGCENFLVKPLSRDVVVKKLSTIVFNVAQKKHSLLLMERARRYRALLEQRRVDRQNGVSGSGAAASGALSERKRIIPPQMSSSLGGS